MGGGVADNREWEVLPTEKESTQNRQQILLEGEIDVQLSFFRNPDEKEQ